MEITELKTVWDKYLDRCYSLYRMAGKTIRIRGVFGGRLVAEVFSPTLLRWELLTMGMELAPKHAREDMDQVTTAVLEEVALILGDDE